MAKPQRMVVVDWIESAMTMNYHVIVERHPFMNGVVGNSIPAIKSSIYLTKINFL